MTSTTELGEWTDEQWRHEWTGWARSGLLGLSGHHQGPPLWPAAGLLRGLEAVANRLVAASAPTAPRCRPDPSELLTGRAALMGLTRNGRMSPGGGCRLLSAADGWVAVSLVRPGDAEVVPAITHQQPGPDPWTDLARASASLPAHDVADRAQLVGVPAGVLPAQSPTAWTVDPEQTRHPHGARPGRPMSRPLVVDLSALWAGPLCAKLLGDAGARVIKVESRQRPDGARFGNAAFFDWLNSAHESVALDFSDRTDLEVVRALVARADVVIEASRPHALKALSIDAERQVADRPGKIWLSITGYGRQGPAAHRVGFGDDASVAAGLVAYDRAGDPVFCGDAAADPITGLQSARAVIEGQARGGGMMIEMSMVDAVRSVLQPLPAAGPSAAGPAVRCGASGVDGWAVSVGGSRFEVRPPALPPPTAPAPAFGAHTAAVVAELARGEA